MKNIFATLLICLLGAFVFAEDFTAESIDEAVRLGDCAYLQSYLDSESPIPALATKAKTTIASYAATQTTTSRFRTEKMDSRVRKVPKEIQEAVFVEPEENLSKVVNCLVGAVADNFMRVKILHDWICDNILYDTEIYFSPRWTNQDYASVLKKKMAVCVGYSNLMQEMCRLAGIEAIVISGYTKRSGFSGKIGKLPDHAWNSVHLGNKWYLVDVTWDASYLEYETAIRKYSTAYLFLEPRNFLYTHLPMENRHQYYAPCLSAENFETEPVLNGYFFLHGLSLGKESPNYMNEISGPMTFQISGKASSSVYAMLFGSSGRLDKSTWVTRKMNKATLMLDLPQKGDYRVLVGCINSEKFFFEYEAAEFEASVLPSLQKLVAEKKVTQKEEEYFRNSYSKVDENRRYYFVQDLFDTPRNNAVEKITKLLFPHQEFSNSIMAFNVKSSADYAGYGENFERFPLTYVGYDKATNTNLVAPMKGELKAGAEELFEMNSTNYIGFAIIIKNEFNFFKKNAKTGNYELRFKIPAGIEELSIYGSRDGRAYEEVLQFVVK